MSSSPKVWSTAKHSLFTSTTSRPFHRSVSTSCSAPRSSSSSSHPPSPSATRSTSRHNKLLYRKVLRTAVLGAYELNLPSPRPPYSLKSQGYQPPKLRQTPSSENGSRAKMVRVDEEQLVRSRFGSSGGKTAQDRKKSALSSSQQGIGSSSSLTTSQKRRLLKGSAWKAGQRRSFSISPTRARLASEDSLQEVDDIDEGIVFEFEGEGKGKGTTEGVSRAKVPRCGDWVETRRNGSPTAGIYLCPSPITTRRFILLSVSGDPSEHALDDITYLLPSIVDSSLAAAATPQYTTNRETGQMETLNPEAGNPGVLEILQQLRKIEFAIEEETKVLYNNGVNDLYRLLLNTNTKSPLTSITISSALKHLRLPPTSSSSSSSTSSSSSSLPISLSRDIALHRIMLDTPQYFLADSNSLRTSKRFDLRDPEEAERFEQVRGWTRGQTGEMKSFADKCAKVREWGREKLRSQKRTTMTKKQGGGKLETFELPNEGAEFRWNEEDRSILKFLRDTLAYERVIQTQPHMSIAPSILKFVDQRSKELGYEGWGMDGEVKRKRIREFLSEVGEVAEWENWAALEKVSGLQGWEKMGESVEKALSRRPSKPTSTLTKVLGSTEYYPTDPHDSIRHDFGNLNVYTIDDPGAFELDDGISISPAAPTSTGGKTHWVHVHIADPTSLLHPSHLVSKLARIRDHTEYFPEKTWSMLPDSFVEKQGMSLGSKEGQEQKVMSFGMRIVEETGETVEQEVKAGVVRKVLRLTYGAVDAALGREAPKLRPPVQYPLPESTDLEVDSPSPPQRHLDDNVLSTDVNTVSSLRTLHGLASKLLRRRASDSALFWNFPTASVSVSPSLQPSFSTSNRPTFYSTAPQIDLHLPPPPGEQRSFVDSPAGLLVSEFMVAANRTAARFSVENGLHVPFRSQGAPKGTPEAIEAVLKLRDPATGQAPAIDILKHSIEFLPGANTPTTGPHWPMGINDEYGYLRVTSPLRRYSDLFCHWQLKSALLPSNLAPSYSTSRFDLPAVLAHIQGFDAAAKARHRLSDAASNFWSLFVISRKLSLLDQISSPTNSLSTSDLSPVDVEFVNLLAGGLTAIPIRKSTHSAFDNLHVQPVIIPQLGVRGTLQVESIGMAPQIGEEVEVKIEEVLLSARSKVVVIRR